MSEKETLRDFIEAAINEYLAANGGGFITGFVLMSEMVGADGSTSAFVIRPESQPVFRSMGYATYLGEWFKDDAAMEMTSLWMPGEDEED